jgi:toxin YoeB
MRQVVFHKRAFEEYNQWAKEDFRTFEKLQELIKMTLREPFDGIGKPEPLKFDKKGYWSRRINSEHRLLYKVTESQIIIASCKYHY